MTIPKNHDELREILALASFRGRYGEDYMGDRPIPANYWEWDMVDAVLSALAASGVRLLPEEPTVSMLATVARMFDDPTEHDHHLAAMAVDSLLPRGPGRADAIVVVAQIARDYRASTLASPFAKATMDGCRTYKRERDIHDARADAAEARVKELEAEVERMRSWGEQSALAATQEVQERAAAAEALALRLAVAMEADEHGGDHHDDACPICRALADPALTELQGLGNTAPETPVPPPFVFEYTNWRGETATRRAVPKRVFFGTTPWHPEPQWLVEAVDIDKGALRCFAMAQMRGRSNG